MQKSSIFSTAVKQGFFLLCFYYGVLHYLFVFFVCMCMRLFPAYEKPEFCKPIVLCTAHYELSWLLQCITYCVQLLYEVSFIVHFLSMDFLRLFMCFMLNKRKDDALM